MRLFRLLSSLLPLAVLTLHAQPPSPADGTYEGSANVRGQDVPIHLRISGPANGLRAAFLNGPEQSKASAATLTGDHLLLTFNYFARTLDATLHDGVLTGTYGTVAAHYPVTLHRTSAAGARTGADTTPLPKIAGVWEIAVHSVKGESAWTLKLAPDPATHTARAVIQRIDGDTGALYGPWTGSEFRVGHVSAAGFALYSIAPRPDGTLLISNLIAKEVERSAQQNLIARRPAEARKLNLPPPTLSTQQTTMKNPSRPLTFRFPDLSGKLVSSTDPRFRGKVVIVAIGGSWCPNCHDEAPFLESLYRQFHDRGLEIVNLSFEEPSQQQNPIRLRAFIKRYGITYPVLMAGDPDLLNQTITQAKNLNSWPTAFFIGRNGLVQKIHAGFAGPGNPQAHEELMHEVTSLVESLLAQPASATRSTHVSN